ncbi:MAG: Long-chain-fatty-acid--CoA ligase [Acidimicrobiales bacterium]|nr:MAG: acyl-CoA synthetase [Actinomycetota bacterium]MBV6507307.1 Long-chain-fatty-acid--CoA ligase [Acidimicrobiales bacterium]RIK04084.1 MAG: acyl-CoA synthetase [Acidobacteriota bacterium]
MFPGAQLDERGDEPAYIMATSGSVITYRDLDEEANRLSRVFRAAGMQPGDHVAFCLENHPHFLAIAWGAHYAGLYYTAISSRLTPPEVAYIVNDCGARAFITSRHMAEVGADIIAETPRVELRLVLDGPLPGHEPYEQVVAEASPTPLDNRLEGMDMLYSSGTTGRPKGVKVPLPGKALGTPGPLQLLLEGLFGISSDTVYLSPAPLYHAAPLRFCMGIQRAGGTVVVMEHFDPEGALELIERQRVTHSQWVPTMFVRMLKLDPSIRDKYDLSSLRVAVHAAAPCPIPVKEQMFDWWGPVLHEYYAGTEGNGFCYAGPEDWLAHKGTVGKPLLGELHIVGEDGEEVPLGETGTVYFGGGATFEYHNDPAKTASARNAEGWSTLGDVGYTDEDGFLYLTDRHAYMIITGGVNVYPQEAENVLTMHPAVYDVAVFGVPDDEFGEQVKAVVQPVDMDRAGPELEQELIEYCRANLAHVKCPRTVDFEAELPRHPTGKLYKRVLKDRYWVGHQSRIV